MLDGVGGAEFNSTPADLPTTWTCGPTVPDADYTVTAVIKKLTAINGGIALVGRWTSANAWYSGVYQDLDGWNIYKADGAGGSVDLVDNADTSWAVGETRTIQLELIGTTINVRSNGTIVATVVDADFAAAGLPGLQMLVYPAQPAPGAATGWHIQDWHVHWGA